MKAAVIPEVNARWELREVPSPRPGPGEVLIAVRASGVCQNDVLATRGAIPFPTTSPAITGHEPIGDIVEVGPGVTDRQVGDRVGVTWVRAGCGRCDWCRHAQPVTGTTAMLCAAPRTTGFSMPGGHAELLVAASGETVLIPDGIAPEAAATVLCAGYTAWSALRAGRPEPGSRVAVVGIGGLGHLALQFARATGLEPVAVTRSADKHDAARRFGAEVVVADGAELAAAGGADIVVLTAPSHAAATDALRGLRPQGRLVLAGIDPDAPLVLPPATQYPFFALGQSIVGATHGDPSHLREALAMVASGAVTPVVETFPADRITEAFDRTAKGAVRFRAVVTW